MAKKKYKKGGTLKDIGLVIGDTALGTFGAGDVIQDELYSNQKLAQVGDLMGTAGQIGLGIATAGASAPVTAGINTATKVGNVANIGASLIYAVGGSLNGPGDPVPQKSKKQLRQEAKAREKRTKAAEKQHALESQARIDAGYNYINQTQIPNNMVVDDQTGMGMIQGDGVNKQVGVSSGKNAEQYKIEMEAWQKASDEIRRTHGSKGYDIWLKKNPAPVFAKGGPIQKVQPIAPVMLDPADYAGDIPVGVPQNSKYGTPISKAQAMAEVAKIRSTAPVVNPSQMMFDKAQRNIAKRKQMGEKIDLFDFNTAGIDPSQIFFADGGELTEYNAGDTHEENPYGGIPLGNDALVEEGETRWEDYIFSDRIKIPKSKQTFAQRSKSIQKKYSDRPHDKMAKEALEIEMNQLKDAQEAIKTSKIAKHTKAIMALGGMLNGRKVFADGGEDTPTINFSPEQQLRLQQLANAQSRGEITMEQYQAELAKMGEDDGMGSFINNMYNQQRQANPATANFTPAGTDDMWSEQELADIARAQANPNFNMGTADQSATGSQDELFNDKLGVDEYIAAFAPAVATAATMIGGPNQTRFKRAQANLIDPTAQLSLTKQQGQTARATLAKNIRNAGTGSGQQLSNLVAGNVGVTQGINQALTNIQSAADQYNTGVQNNVNQMNTNIAMQETIANEQNKSRWQEMGLAALQSAANTYLGTKKDNRAFEANNLYNNEFLRLANTEDFIYNPFTGEAISYKNK